MDVLPEGQLSFRKDKHSGENETHGTAASATRRATRAPGTWVLDLEPFFSACQTPTATHWCAVSNMVGARVFLFFVMFQVMKTKAGFTVWTTSLSAFGAGHVLGADAWVKGTVQRRAAPRVQAWVVCWEHGDVESTVCARVLHAEPGAAPFPLPPEHGANVAGDADASM